MLAVAAIAMSSVSVVTNALRLRRLSLKAPPAPGVAPRPAPIEIKWDRWVFMACRSISIERRTLVKSRFCRAVAALIVIAGLAGCAATGAQEPWFELQDRLLWYNAAD